MYLSWLVLLLAHSVFSADPQSPDKFSVVFQTSVASGDGSFTLDVDRSLSPLGADRFYALVKDEFFTKTNNVDGAAFFRVVDTFIVQFGISGDPAETSKFRDSIEDDPAIEGNSNVAATVAFATAGANTRTSQIFINLKDNTQLDGDGFTPFGKVSKGMDVVNAIVNPTPDDTDGINQNGYGLGGDSWLAQQGFDYNVIVNATLV